MRTPRGCGELVVPGDSVGDRRKFFFSVFFLAKDLSSWMTAKVLKSTQVRARGRGARGFSSAQHFPAPVCVSICMCMSMHVYLCLYMSK